MEEAERAAVEGARAAREAAALARKELRAEMQQARDKEMALLVVQCARRPPPVHAVIMRSITKLHGELNR